MLKIRIEFKDRAPTAVECSTMVFPGGELHVTAPVAEFTIGATRINIAAELRSAHDIMELLLATDALRRQVPGVPVFLFMPYVPYARQDRVANHGEALSIRVFCDLINAQDYARVYVTDPHSDVAAALIDRCTARLPVVELYRVVEAIGGDCLLVCPDAGARKRVHAMAQQLKLGVLHADKVRNTQTGEITGTVVDMAMTDPDVPLLVIDDICDGGRTFIELAKAIRGLGHTGPLYLYVTHGIFSKGIDALAAFYDRIYTLRDWLNSGHPCVIEMK